MTKLVGMVTGHPGPGALSGYHILQWESTKIDTEKDKLNAM